MDNSDPKVREKYIAELTERIEQRKQAVEAIRNSTHFAPLSTTARKTHMDPV